MLENLLGYCPACGNEVLTVDLQEDTEDTYLCDVCEIFVLFDDLLV